MKKVLLALASSLLASFANANPVIIDPNGLAEGTDLSTAYPGVTLRHVTLVAGANGQEVVVDNVYAKECPTVSDPNSECYFLGSGHFGYLNSAGGISGSFSAESSASINCITGGNPNSCRWMQHDFLDVTFDVAVQQVTIDGTHRSDWPWAWAFDAAGNLLQVDLQATLHNDPQSNYVHQTLTVTPLSGQISRVVFAGLGGFVRLDKLTYTP